MFNLSMDLNCEKLKNLCLNPVVLHEVLKLYKLVIVKKMAKMCDTFLCPCVIMKRIVEELKVRVVVGVYLHGAGVDLKILMTFHQAVRVVEITVFMKQGSRLVVFKKGMSESVMFWQ